MEESTASASKVIIDEEDDEEEESESVMLNARSRIELYERRSNFYDYDNDEDSSSDEDYDEDEDDIARIYRRIEGYCSYGNDVVEDLSENADENNILSKNAPPSLETCLVLSMAQQRLLQQTLRLLQNLTEENDELQKSIEESMNSDSSSVEEDNFQIDNFRKFGMPYFKGNDSFPCPPNSDMLLKNSRKELDLAHLPFITKWQNWEMQLLDNAVWREAEIALKRPLQNRVQCLEESIRSTMQSGDNAEGLRQKLKSAEAELATVSKDDVMDRLSGGQNSQPIDWMKIAVHDFHLRRTAGECESMWNCCLRRDLKRKSWSDAETAMLKSIASKLKYQDWDLIAKELGTSRSAYQCYVHFQVTLNRDRNRWTAVEDKKLIETINACRQGSYIPFGLVASFLPGRTTQQVRQRWTISLDPKIQLGHFTVREDLILAAGRHTHGLTFRQISSLLPGRTANQLRIRYGRLQDVDSASPWTQKDDEKLVTNVENQGKNWSVLAEDFPSKNREQCRQRYDRLLKGQQNSKPVNYLAVRKGSMWKRIDKKEITEKKNFSKLMEGDVESFLTTLKGLRRTGRKHRKRDLLDTEISKMFRSFFSQPKGRKKKRFSDEDRKVIGKEGKELALVFGINFDWAAMEKEEPPSESDPEAFGLHLLKQEFKLEHVNSNWNSNKTKLDCLVPPNITTLIGFRTMLLEEDNLLQQWCSASQGETNQRMLMARLEQTSSLLDPDRTPCTSVITSSSGIKSVPSANSNHVHSPQAMNVSNTNLPQILLSPMLSELGEPIQSPINLEIPGPSPLSNQNMGYQPPEVLSWPELVGPVATLYPTPDSPATASPVVTQNLSASGSHRLENYEINSTAAPNYVLDASNRLKPKTAEILWLQRFLALFMWPSMMSKEPPSMNYRNRLFEGERMVCADEVLEEENNEDANSVPKKVIQPIKVPPALQRKGKHSKNAEVEEEDQDMHEEVHALSIDPASLEPKKYFPKGGKRQRKAFMRERWEKYRQLKKVAMGETNLGVASQEESPSKIIISRKKKISYKPKVVTPVNQRRRSSRFVEPQSSSETPAEMIAGPSHMQDC